MSVIEVSHITKDYGDNKGVFDISFTVEQGEILGFLGPNGSGKTTTIRQLLGFIASDLGNVTILGLDAFKEAAKTNAQIGYLPGEIAFMDDMTGIEFIEFMAKMKKIDNLDKAHELIEFLELDASSQIKRMSKGMKQKVGLVIALMQDAPILILDEPTSGLDPLMQTKFVKLMQKAKQDGKTILMSSHIFEEIEHTCDRILMIKDGKLIASDSIENLTKNKMKHYKIHFRKSNEATMVSYYFPGSVVEGNMLTLDLQGNPTELIRKLALYDVEDIEVQPQSLEEIFLQYYGGDKE